MPIDPRISLGVQQIQLPDPVARYGQLATIQNAQNQNALAQYQLGTAKREEETTNALNEAWAKSYDPTTGKINRNTLRETLAKGGFGSKLPGVEKTLLELDKEELAQRETGFKVERAKNDFIAQAKRDTSQNPSDANLTAFKEDLIANPLFNAAEKTQMAANVDRILAMPVDQRRSFMASQGASAGELKPTVQTVNRDGQTDVLRVPAFSGAPSVVGTYADVPLPAPVLAQKKDVARSGAANVTNVQEKAEAQDYGKLLVKDFEGVKTQATVAARSLPAIESNLATLDKGFDTGFGTETIAAGAKVLGALGVQKAEDFATDAQTFLASANAAVLQRQLEQKGPQTESDAQRITATGAQLGNTKAANRFVLNVAKAQLQRDIDQRKFYSDWRTANKTLEGAEDAWFAGPGSKSLFESPTLKKYSVNAVDQIPGQSRAAPAATAIPQAAINALKAGKGTDAQFDAIFGAGAAKRARGGK
jgi:hypothetical protein